MANFPTGKSLNLTMSGSAQTVAVTYKENFFLLAHPDNVGNITILAGDNNITVWILAPGDSWQISSLTATLFTAVGTDVPLKVQGTASDLLIGFLV